MEGNSIGAVDGRSYPKCNQGFIPRHKLSVAKYPTNCGSVLIEHCAWHFINPSGDETESFLNLSDNLLPIHLTPPLNSVFIKPSFNASGSYTQNVFARIDFEI